MKSAPRIFGLLKSRRVWAGVALFLAAWQSGVFAVAYGARLAGAGAGRPALSEAERAFVSSLTEPDEAARQESLREVAALRRNMADGVGPAEAASAEAECLGLVLRGRSAEALAVLEGGRLGLYGDEKERVAECLRRLAAEPGEFGARLALAEAVADFSGRAPNAYMALCWWLLDRAPAEAERAALLRLLARVFEREHFYTTARLLYVAAARLSASSNSDDERLAAALAGVAEMESLRGGENDGEREKGSRLLAAEVYRVAAEKFPASRQLKRRLLNRGKLLREAGYGEAAEAVLLPLLAGRDDDDTMERLQNYKPVAAMEIARSYADRHDFPKAYDWERRAVTEYPLVFECGTGLGAYERRRRLALFGSSMKAGPLFILMDALRAVVSF